MLSVPWTKSVLALYAVCESWTLVIHSCGLWATLIDFRRAGALNVAGFFQTMVILRTLSLRVASTTSLAGG